MISHRVVLHGPGEGVVGDLQRQASERGRGYIYRSLAFLEHSQIYDPLDFLFDGSLDGAGSTTVVLDQLVDIRNDRLVSEIAGRLSLWSELSPELSVEFYWPISSANSLRAGAVAALLHPLVTQGRSAP